MLYNFDCNLLYFESSDILEEHDASIQFKVAQK